MKLRLPPRVQRVLPFYGPTACGREGGTQYQRGKLVDVRVLKVQRVQRIQSGVVGAWGASLY